MKTLRSFLPYVAALFLMSAIASAQVPYAPAPYGIIGGGSLPSLTLGGNTTLTGPSTKVLGLDNLNINALQSGSGLVRLENGGAGGNIATTSLLYTGASTAPVTIAANDSGRTVTNEASAVSVDVTMPAGVATGYWACVYDVGGTGGIGLIVPAGESIRLGTSIVSSTNRKVASTTGNGAKACIRKVTMTSWQNYGGFDGTWTGT